MTTLDSTSNFNTILDHINNPILFFVEESFAWISLILLVVLFGWTSHSFSKKKSIVITSRVKCFCLISLLSYSCMSLISVLFVNNFITGNLSSEMCTYAYPSYFLTYNIGNISSYWVISFRMQSLYPVQVYKQFAVSSNISNIYRFLSLLIPTALWTLFVYFAFNHIIIIQTFNNKYKYCYAIQFELAILAQNLLILLAIWHIIFVLFVLFVILSKSIQISQIMLHAINREKFEYLKKSSSLLRKTTVLSLISILSTVIILCLSAYIIQQAILFLVIDALINSICIIFLFDFAASLYTKLCINIENCCKCFYCMDKRLIANDSYAIINGVRKGYVAPNKVNDISNTAYLANTSQITIVGKKSNLSGGSGSGSDSGVTELSGYTNVLPLDLDIEDSQKTASLLLHKTNSTVSGFQLELQSTMT